MHSYIDIWNQLKRDNTVSITANRALHARLVKAVIKRKWLDVAYKLEIDPRTAILTHTKAGAVIIFKLTLYHNWSTIKPEEVDL